MRAALFATGELTLGTRSLTFGAGSLTFAFTTFRAENRALAGHILRAILAAFPTTVITAFATTIIATVVAAGTAFKSRGRGGRGGRRGLGRVFPALGRALHRFRREDVELGFHFRLGRSFDFGLRDDRGRGGGGFNGRSDRCHHRGGRGLGGGHGGDVAERIHVFTHRSHHLDGRGLVVAGRCLLD